jgi:hypothetical protein
LHRRFSFSLFYVNSQVGTEHLALKTASAEFRAGHNHRLKPFLGYLRRFLEDFLGTHFETDIASFTPFVVEMDGDGFLLFARAFLQFVSPPLSENGLDGHQVGLGIISLRTREDVKFFYKLEPDFQRIFHDHDHGKKWTKYKIIREKRAEAEDRRHLALRASAGARKPGVFPLTKRGQLYTIQRDFSHSAPKGRRG